MLRKRACDPCAARKTKCDRQTPCRGCKGLGLSCSTLRAYSKPGPRGPWAKKKRARDRSEGSLLNAQSPDATASSKGTKVDHGVPIDEIKHCLEFYAQDSYSLWPVIKSNDLSTRLNDKANAAAFAVAAAVAAVVIEREAQLGKLIGVENCRENSERLAAESEKARAKLLYQQRPSTDVLLSSFFLHIHYANRGQICKATLLLREAITFAQFLELDQAKHYTTLSVRETQAHLRILWLLHITERGHTTRFDFPRILRLDPHLPALRAEEDPSGLLPFISMTRLFQNFGCAMDDSEFDRTSHFFAAMDVRLEETRELLSNTPESQRADFLITKQWMRMILWKRAMFNVELSTDIADGSLSISFPEQLARNVMTYINDFPRAIVQAHGLGMQMKLADIAISFADVLSCMPCVSKNYQLMQGQPRDILNCLAGFIASIPNSVNPRLGLLQEKLTGTVWALPLDYPRESEGGTNDEFEEARATGVPRCVARDSIHLGALPREEEPTYVVAQPGVLQYP